MASSSGNSNSSGSTLLQNSGSEEDLHQLMDQRKRKIMESNRESARRSRMRKQKRLDNYQILTNFNFITHQYLNMEAENSVLRAKIIELSQRLDSLNGILNHLNNPRISNGVYESEAFETSGKNFTNFIDPFNLAYLNQPIVVTADVFQ
ncbi:putative HIT-type Zinc finger family protein [Hibiscus syriacus]|uniref:HIT-type Zinc finger family protein n=1 Tax=Hibiscus syriacus TaxID=106335 RepID=A0A6A2WL89_HIBSY|nr:bZIP transcription factor 44-like [Hibiscus syriacus]KAE8654020.1 putative HIT-type Zinc finger family protein [Hibiscus syriacus]